LTGYLYHTFKGHNQKYDAIVIGSGIGGLSVSSLLAKEGKKILLLERHYAIGGYTHSFKRKGYEWDTGLHYVGQVHIDGTPLNKVFRYVSNGNLRWDALDDTYDRIVFGDKLYEFVRGRDNLKAKLKEYFPNEEDKVSIDNYFELLKKVEKLGIGYYIEKVIPPFLARLFGGLLRRKVLKYSDKTTLSVLKSLTTNEQLIGVLTSQYGDYGLLPSESSFYMHAQLANHYIDGAGYPVGGSKSIAESVVPIVEEHGGAVLFSAEVLSVIVENNKAVGVKMADGKEIRANLVISDAGVFNTFSKLLPSEVQDKHHLKEKLEKLEPAAAHMGLYIGINQSTESLNLPKCNYWIFPNEYNHEKGRAKYKDFADEIPVAFVSFPSAKDSEWKVSHPNKTTVEVVIILPFEWFFKWEKTEWKKRDADYEKMKEQVAEQMLELLYKVEPQLKGKVDYYEVSTPLSTNKFTNYSKGEIYGIAHTPKRFRQEFLKPYTPVKNLFMTGQDTIIASIAGGLMGGVLCASAILKKDVFSKIIKTVK